MGITYPSIFRRIIVTISFLCPCFAGLVAQPDSSWVEHDLAVSCYQNGTRLLANGEYQLALAAFDSVLMQPFHQQTTSATYLSALCYYYMGMADSAARNLEAFLADYPASTYKPEALFHLSTLYLEGPPVDRPTGLKGLLGLSEQDSVPALATAAKTKIREYFFTSCDTSLLIPLLRNAPETEIPFYLEPYCYCLQEKLGQGPLAELVYQEYLFQYEVPLPVIERLFDKRKVDRYGDRENIKMAVFLPLFLEEDLPGATPSVPRKSKIALEFWEGLKMAYEEIEPDLRNRITLKVFDTQRDSTTVAMQIQELDEWYPDLVIGAVYNKQTEIISDWAEKTGTPQIVPFSPSGKLVTDKQFTFLAHPDISVHGKKMADYAFDSLHLRSITVFSNKTAATAKLAEPFRIQFLSRGGKLSEITVDSLFDKEETEGLVSRIQSIREHSFDGVFIPIFGDQETTGLILSQLSVMELNMPVLASPHAWKRYGNIDRDLKDRFQLTFSTSFMCNPRDSLYRNYLNTALEQYHVPPSDFHTQGYDIGIWILRLISDYPFRYLSLADFIREYPTSKGLHQDIGFEGKQCNQSVNLGRFHNGVVEKLELRTRWILEPEQEQE